MKRIIILLIVWYCWVW